MLGECPAVWLCWPDSQPLEQGQHLWPLATNRCRCGPDGGNPTPRYWRRTPNLVNGWRRPAWGGVAAARPSFPAGPTPSVLSVSTGDLRPLEHAPPRPASQSGHRRFPLTYGVLHGEAVGGATSVWSDSGRDLCGNPAAWRRCGFGSGPSLQQSNRRRCSPAAHPPSPVAGRRTTLKAFTRDGFRAATAAQRFFVVRGRSIFENRSCF